MIVFDASRFCMCFVCFLKKTPSKCHLTMLFLLGDGVQRINIIHSSGRSTIRTVFFLDFFLDKKQRKTGPKGPIFGKLVFLDLFLDKKTKVGKSTFFGNLANPKKNTVSFGIVP